MAEYGKGTTYTRLNDPELRKLRALMILQTRVQGTSLPDLATKFNVSEHTIRNEIDYAKREGLVAQFEDQVIEQLVPKAIAAFKTALENGDTTVATEVLKGMGILRKPSDRPVLRPEAAAPAEDSLEIHIKRISKGGNKLENPHSQQRRIASGPAGFIDAGRDGEDAAERLPIIEASVVPNRGEGREADSQRTVDGANNAPRLRPEPPAPPAGDGA